MARTKSVLGDVRRDERAEWMLERIVASGSLVLRELGGTRSGEMAAHRLLSSDDVDPTGLLTPHVARTAAACNGRRGGGGAGYDGDQFRPAPSSSCWSWSDR